jgi:hypothetical protein
MSAYTVRMHMRRTAPRSRSRLFTIVRAALIVGSAAVLAFLLGGMAAL